MPRATVADRLRQMLEAITAIRRYMNGKTFEEYRHGSMLRDAVERNLERLSEAPRHIPDRLKAERPDVPWRQVAAIGNVLRHAYDGVDDREIWDTVMRDLAPLESALNVLLAISDNGPGQERKDEDRA